MKGSNKPRKSRFLFGVNQPLEKFDNYQPEHEALSDSRMLIRDQVREESSFWSADSKEGMVASAHYKATKAGAEVLEKGGNAFDAAIAASLALTVLEPNGSGLAGMAMAVVHIGDSQRTLALAAPCRAPRFANPKELILKPRYNGYGAVAVPTYVSWIDYVFRNYASLSLSTLIEPAIEYAESGALLTKQFIHLVEKSPRLQKGSMAAIFRDPNGNPLQAGQRWRQPALARTLKRLARVGLRDFYEGEIARSMVQDMQANGGCICLDDLKSVDDPSVLSPRVAKFRGVQVHTVGPPAGGTALLQMLSLFEKLEDKGFEPDDPRGFELMIRIMEQSRWDRKQASLIDRMDPRHDSEDHVNRSAKRVAAKLQSGETSHLCVLDRWGNAVSLTQSIERTFGAKVGCPDLGFLYNGYIKGFKLKRPNHPHYLRPGNVARSNAAPTLVCQDKKVVAVVGSTGSERMASGIFQVLIRLGHQCPFDAVHAARIHATPTKKILLEYDRFDERRIEYLGNSGLREFMVQRMDAYSFKMGGLQLITRSGPWMSGVADPRRGGAAAGPKAGNRKSGEQ